MAPPTGYLDPSLHRADTSMESTLGAWGPASERNYQRELQELGQAGTEPTCMLQTHVLACTHTHTCACIHTCTPGSHSHAITHRRSQSLHNSLPHPHTLIFTSIPSHSVSSSHAMQSLTRDHGVERSWLRSLLGPVFNTKTSQLCDLERGTPSLPALLSSSVKWA